MTNNSNPSRGAGETGTVASAASRPGQSKTDRESHGKDAVGRDAVGKDAVGKDAVGKDAVGKDAVGKDAVGKDAVGKDAVGKDAVGKTQSQGNNQSKGGQGKGGQGKGGQGKGGQGKGAQSKGGQGKGAQGKGGQSKSQSRGKGQSADKGAAGASDTLPGGNGGSAALARRTHAGREASPGGAETVGASTGANGAAAGSPPDSRSADAPPQVEAGEAVAARGAEKPSDGSAEPSVNADGSAEPSVSAPAPDRPTGLQLLLHLGRPRATRAQLVVALLCGLLGFALVTQVHSQANTGLSSARQADLVDVLDNLSTKSEQLQSRIADEQRTLAKLTGGTGQTEAALEEAQQRATTLRILAGTIGATGPGIDLRISDAGRNVTADVLLDTLEELRDAGAEAVEIRGAGTPAPAVRLVASSYFVDAQDGQGVIADGTALSPPYDILAIGDPPTLTAAMGIPGGVLDTLKSKGAKGVVSQSDTVRITALHALTPPQYAHPAASPSAGS